MYEINFVTSNSGKLKSLEEALNSNNINAKIIGTDLNIIEPQLDTVAEVSRHKALEAFKILNKPVFVEDSGMSIEALKGFPGIYTKYVVAAIGVDGFLSLMKDKENRKVKFESVASFVDEKGNITQFKREGGEFEMAYKKTNINHPSAWSELWQILYSPEYKKTLSEFSQEELDDFLKRVGASGSLQKFAKWYAENI